MRMINVTLSCQFLPGVHKQCNTRDSHLHLAARRSTQLTEGKEKRLVKTPSSFFSCSSSSIVIVMVILMLKFMLLKSYGHIDDHNVYDNHFDDHNFDYNNVGDHNVGDHNFGDYHHIDDDHLWLAG